MRLWHLAFKMFKKCYYLEHFNVNCTSRLFCYWTSFLPTSYPGHTTRKGTNGKNVCQPRYIALFCLCLHLYFLSLQHIDFNFVTTLSNLSKKHWLKALFYPNYHRLSKLYGIRWSTITKSAIFLTKKMAVTLWLTRKASWLRNTL